MFGQVIIAMAHHHYLSLEGGHLMIEFVVRQSAVNLDDKVRVRQLHVSLIPMFQSRFPVPQSYLEFIPMSQS